MKRKPKSTLQFLITAVLIGFNQAGKLCNFAEKFPHTGRHCSDCVRQEQCGCYEAETQLVIPEGDFYVNANCTLKGDCINGEIHWNDGYHCGHNAECDVRDNVRQCYCSWGYIGDGETCMIPKDCQDIYENVSKESEIYRIKPTDWRDKAFEVYCNMSDGGGWTVFQRRVDGLQDFYLGWNSYKEGFGNLSHEFWLGNDKLHYITKQTRYEIRIDLVNKLGAPYYAKFDFFRINNESDNYRLSGLGKYSGTADVSSIPNGEALRYHFNSQFSTRDRDNDNCNNDCVSINSGAWWFRCCDHSNLNADYFASVGEASVEWNYLPGGQYHINFTEMKVRPK